MYYRSHHILSSYFSLAHKIIYLANDAFLIWVNADEIRQIADALSRCSFNLSVIDINVHVKWANSKMIGFQISELWKDHVIDSWPSQDRKCKLMRWTNLLFTRTVSRNWPKNRWDGESHTHTGCGSNFVRLGIYSSLLQSLRIIFRARIVFWGGLQQVRWSGYLLLWWW